MSVCALRWAYLKRRVRELEKEKRVIKREELSNPSSCMSKAADDEMTFVLLGRDAAAPYAIRVWCAERIRLGKNLANDDQILEAWRCAEQMEGTRKLDAQISDSDAWTSYALSKGLQHLSNDVITASREAFMAALAASRTAKP